MLKSRLRWKVEKEHEGTQDLNKAWWCHRLWRGQNDKARQQNFSHVLLTCTFLWTWSMFHIAQSNEDKRSQIDVSNCYCYCDMLFLGLSIQLLLFQNMIHIIELPEFIAYVHVPIWYMHKNIFIHYSTNVWVPIIYLLPDTEDVTVNTTNKMSCFLAY